MANTTPQSIIPFSQQTLAELDKINNLFMAIAAIADTFDKDCGLKGLGDIGIEVSAKLYFKVHEFKESWEDQDSDAA